MQELYFDTRDSSLLLGKAAIGPRLEEAGPLEVVSVRDLLVAEDFPYTRTDETRIQEPWQKEDFIALGSHLLKLLATDEEPRPVVTREHFRRAHILHMSPYGPWHHAMPNLRHLRQKIGSPEGHVIGRYNNWSPAQFRRYAMHVSEQVGRRPTKEDFNAANGPSAKVIRKHFGSIGELMESIGYPNVREWQPEDFVLWGVKVMRANPHRRFNSYLLEDLSRLDRGPSETPIRTHFGSFTNYREQVEEEFVRQENQRAIVQDEKLAQFQQLMDQDGLPNMLLGISDEEKLLFVAKYELAKYSLSHHVERKKLALNIACQPVSKLRMAIGAYNNDLTTATLENNAMILNVYDILWPADELADYLKVA